LKILFKGIQPESDQTTTAKPNLQKWGKGSVRVYGTINGPNQEPGIELNLQANPETINLQANNEVDFGKLKEMFLCFFISLCFVLYLVVRMTMSPPAP
jgi:hypothetical protein